MHVLRYARRRVQGDRGPDGVDIVLRDAVAAQEVTGGICAVNLEALVRAAVLMGQPHVVEHRASIKQLRIEFQFVTLARQSAPVINTARMVKQKWRLGIPYQLRYFASELAVGNSNSRKVDIYLNVDIHAFLLAIGGDQVDCTSMRCVPTSGSVSVPML